MQKNQNIYYNILRELLGSPPPKEFILIEPIRKGIDFSTFLGHPGECS
jgi:hypothetical protein